MEVFGCDTRLVAMHAGLECGVIGEKYPGMQLISFGPQIENPHSPNERVEISSVVDFLEILEGRVGETVATNGGARDRPDLWTTTSPSCQPRRWRPVWSGSASGSTLLRRLARLGTIAPTTRDPVPRRLPLSIDRRGDLARQTHIIALRTLSHACSWLDNLKVRSGHGGLRVSAEVRRPPPIAGAAAS